MTAQLPEKPGILQRFVTAIGEKFSTTPIDPKNFYPSGRGYFSGGRSSGSKYPGALSRHTEGLTFNHWQIRQNARDSVFDNPQAAALVERFVDSIVDRGLVVEFTPKWRQLGIAEEQAFEWARDHEERFDMYMRSKQAHIAESLTGYQFQRQYSRFQQRDNDMFVRFHYSQRQELMSPLQLGFIDPNQIRSDEFTSTYGPVPQDDGIERDQNGKEKAYRVWFPKPAKNGGFEHKTIPAVGPRSKRTMMIHGYDPLYAGQGRGISRIYHILTEFEKLTDFSLAKIANAINQSNYTMYVKPSADNPASDPTEGMPNSGPRRTAVDTAGEPAVASDSLVDYCSLPEATQDTPGSVGLFSLQEGEDLKFLEHNIQGDSYQSFVDAFTSYLSSSVGMPIEVLLMRFNSNYSASRAALVMFWRICKIWRDEIDADLMSPWIVSWLSEEIAAGRTQAPGWSDPRMKAAWSNHNLIGAPMPNIDPAKEAKAHKDMLDISATTQDRISRETNGTRAADNIAQNKQLFGETPVGPWTVSRSEVDTEENEGEEEEE